MCFPLIRSLLPRVRLRWRAAFLLAAVLLAWGAATAAQATTLRVGVPDFPPDIYLQPDGRAGGLLAEILSHIAAQETLELQAQPCHWADCVELLQAGAIDLLPDVRYTAARTLLLDFHQVPVLTRSSLIFAPEDQHMEDWQALAGKRIAVLQGSMQHDLLASKLLDQHLSATLIPIRELEDGFRLVQTGEADATVADDFTGALSAPRYHLAATAILLETSQIFYAAPKGHQAALLTRIDQYLQTWKSQPDSPYHQILARWGHPSAPPAPKGHGPLLSLLAAVSLLAASLYAWRRKHRFRDTLTNLPNRHMLYTRVEQALVLARNQETLGALLILDVDDLNRINDQYGLAAGDRVLQTIGHRLINNTYPRDIVSRTDGDEFTILLTMLGSHPQEAAHQALKVADKLHQALTQSPVPFGAHLCPLRISIGMTLLNSPEATLERCLQEARIALNRAEDLGGNQIILFDHAIQQQLRYQRDLEQDLAYAITAQQIEVHLQPQIDRHGCVSGAELLTRWTHPQLGSMPPSRFIPLAQAQGLLTLLTCQTLTQACHLLNKLAALGLHYPLSVNLSPATLADPDFVRMALRIVKETGASGRHLIFEITEDLDLESDGEVGARMDALAAQGIRFSLDDFGSGYANLTKLQKLPIHELKIDKSLIDGLPQQSDSATIVQLILILTRKLKLRVVAEGVEQQAQADFLFKHHCDAIQGYLFARPMPVAAWLQQETDCFYNRTGPYERWRAITTVSTAQGTLASQASVPNFS